MPNLESTTISNQMVPSLWNLFILVAGTTPTSTSSHTRGWLQLGGKWGLIFGDTRDHKAKASTVPLTSSFQQQQERRLGHIRNWTSNDMQREMLFMLQQTLEMLWRKRRSKNCSHLQEEICGGFVQQLNNSTIFWEDNSEVWKEPCSGESRVSMIGVVIDRWIS